MTLHQRPFSEELPATSPTKPGQSLWSWRRVAQGVWIVLALVLLVIFGANIPAFYRIARAGCALPSPTDCGSGLLTTGNFQALARLHLPVRVAAEFFATLILVVSAMYWAVGLLIFWRKSQEWLGLFASQMCVLFGAIGMFAFPGTTLTPPLVQFLTNSAYFVLTPGLYVFGLTFPTGRFTPRWTWVVCVPFFLSMLPFVPLIAQLLSCLPLVAVQIYRYVRIYDAVQRQQTKWFVFGVGSGFSFIALYTVLGMVVPGLGVPDSWYQLLSAVIWPLIWVIFLLGMCIPILRYRLWDIDVLINRTLVYGSLTALLVGLYVGIIFALQSLFQAVFKQHENDVTIVVSTLVIAALFQPLRRGLQQAIDRRFYRRKYDAAKIIKTFSATLHNEVDLNQLR